MCCSLKERMRRRLRLFCLLKHTRAFFIWKSDDINGVVVSDRKKTVRLARQNGEMLVVEPSGARASADLIDSLLDAIAGAVMIDELEPSKDQTLYGLDPPAFSLQVYTRDDAEPLTLLLGSNAPSMINMYASLPQQNRTVLLGTYLRFTLKIIPGKCEVD